MEEEIKNFLENNKILKEYTKYSKEELEVIRLYINLELINIQKDKEKNITKIRMIKTCMDETYNYLDYMLSYRYKVDTSLVSIEDNLERLKDKNVCEYCSCNNCIKKTIAILIDEVDKYNENSKNKISYLNLIDYLLEKKLPEFKEEPEKSFFSSVDLIDLMYVYIILESDFVFLNNFDKKNKIAKFNYLDLTKKVNNEYYINMLIEYYKNKRNAEELELDINNVDNIFNEKDKFLRIYKIATYYKYLIEIEKIDIIKTLRKMLSGDNTEKGMRIRSKYFVYKSFQKVEQLPYTKKTKDKIYSILNYILNYRYRGGTPFVPINILIYSNDKEGVENICRIIGEFMWFFGYLADNMKYYSEYINNVILDKYLVKKLYDDNDKKKNGILLLHNFENLLYTDSIQQDLTLNILTDEMEKNNRWVCTIIYGEQEMLKQIISNHYKLSQMLINLELEIDNLDIEKIYELVVEKLEKNINVSEDVKEKIYNYIKATYMQSDTQNMEYVNKLYNRIILNMNNEFSLQKKQELTSIDIPEAYNTKDLPTTMKDINDLVGLSEIKEQISDLVALLKFNKKANININNFNLHMVFAGNPGTGKTTVARLLKDIFYNLGYIKQNKLIEVTARDLIAEYVGQTSGKTYSVIKSALGGVLFIDEAYAITSGDGKFGNECIATLLKLMEDYKDKLIIVFAGYEDEMKNFQESNPGLVSRIGYKINFPDYNLEELTQIYLNLLEKNKLKINDKALKKVQEIIKESSYCENFGNARYINTMFQKILIEHAKNIESNIESNNLYEIVEEDIRKENLVVSHKKKKIGF